MAANYTFEGPSWANNTISWSFATGNYAGQPAQFSSVFAPGSTLANSVAAAFNRWASVSNVTFVQVNDGANVNIRLGYDTIDGPGKTLAVTNYRFTGAKFESDTVIRFDSAEPYSNTASPALANGVYFYAVALHEIGHALGLDHYEGATAIMNAIANPGLADLTQSEIDGIRAIYGIPPALLINLVYGTAGTETLYGTNSRNPAITFDEIIFGNGGADVIYGGGGNDWLWASSGDFSPVFFYGGNDNDVLVTFEGNDFLSGDAGNDILISGAGNDQLYGGDGNDSLWGGSGADAAYGGNGNDIIVGGLAADIGADLLYGGDGNDVVIGGASSDAIYGGNGNDSLWGGEGDDALYGGFGTDVLVGGNGNDTLVSYGGYSTLIGGGGADRYTLVYNNNTIWGYDSAVDSIQLPLLSQALPGNSSADYTVVAGQTANGVTGTAIVASGVVGGAPTSYTYALLAGVTLTSASQLNLSTFDRASFTPLA